MKRAIIIFAGIFAAMTVFQSCDESLLDIPQQGVQSEESFYKTDEDAEAAIAAVYQRFRFTNFGQTTARGGGDRERASGTVMHIAGIWLKELLADDMISGKDDEPFGQCAVRANDPYVQWYYGIFYQTIYLANVILTKFEPGQSEVIDRAIAEAKFFRAYCYYELTTLWDEVPLVDRILATTEEQQVPAASQEELWAFIEKDLNEALSCPYIPTKTNINDLDGAGRLTTQAIRTLMGKVYLWQKKYHEAVEAMKPIIESKAYKLVDDSGVFYHTSGNGCPEYIMETVRYYDTNNMDYQYGWKAISINWEFGYYLFAGPEATKHYDFASSGYGWGFLEASEDLYNTFMREEGENGYRYQRAIVPVEKLREMNLRFGYDATCAGKYGYLQFKLLPTDADDPYTAQYYGVNCSTPVFRYADVLLMMSEACFNDGDKASAEEYLNAVRTRAQLKPKSGITMDDIKLERRLELCMEGLRWQDIKRWGDAPTILKDKGKKIPMYEIIRDPDNDYYTAEGIYNAKYTFRRYYIDNIISDCGWQDRDIVLPFPETEILTNKALKQKYDY